LQLFVNLYPESERSKEAADLIQKLRDKLELKAFANARLYYDMGLTDDYRAAVIALQNVLKEYPDTKYAEEIEFLTLKAQYIYASKSFFLKQESRFDDALDYYRSFASNFPNSKHMKEAESLRENSEKGIKTALSQVKDYNKAVAEQEVYIKEQKAKKEKENTQKDESKK
ncbi:outer membrane protein assembly factor BamD, partial [Sphingobacterium multivorum]